MALPISYGASKAARLASAQEFLPSGFGASTAAVSGRSSAASSTAKYYNQLSEQISKITAQNNAWSAAQAAQQMAFQRESAQTAMAFNREEAQKNRDWQQYMSDTAHQREIKDLQAAGLNPVLSAMGGNGAPVTSGATASGYASQGAKGDTDTSASGALVSLLGSLIQSQTQLANTATSANASLAVADKYTQMQKFVGELQANTQLTTSKISAMASKYAADTGASATQAAAAIHAAAQKYGYDVNAMTQKQIASFNSEVNWYLQQDKQAHEFDMEKYFPKTEIGAAASGLQMIGDLLTSGGSPSVNSASGRSGSISGSSNRTWKDALSGSKSYHSIDSPPWKR